MNSSVERPHRLRPNRGRLISFRQALRRIRSVLSCLRRNRRKNRPLKIRPLQARLKKSHRRKT
jgi:hypothetical protein